jgi:chromosome segregation ATPase
MKINDILTEAGDDSSDYQQMQAFVRANRVGGVPADQQVALALFKELKKQRAQNAELGRELSAAEQRIDQAMSSGELSKKELGMHQAELDRERGALEKQQAAIGQLGQQYSEREQASTAQIAKLADQLEQVKNQPGVDAKAAEALEKQIEDLNKNSVPVAKLAELEKTIGQIQNQSQVDDTAIEDLVAQVKAAQAATQELAQTKQSVTQDVKQTLQATQDQVAQMRQDIDVLRRIESDLEIELNDLNNSYKETDATVWDIESKTLPDIIDWINQNKNATAGKPAQPQPQPQPQQPQLTPNARATAQRLINKGVLKPEPVSESPLHRAIEWAVGKRS